MSTASELLMSTGDISQGSPSVDGGISQGLSAGDATSSNLEGAISQGSPAWLGGVQDAELREFIQNKGWNDPGEMAQGYRNLEKLVGGEKVPLPKGDTDNEGWDRVYKALGRPAKPEDYQLPDLESAQAYHKLGLTGRQATGLSAWQDTLQAAREQKAKEETASQRAQQLAAVRKEWGVEFDENVRLGKRAVREFGLENSVEKLEAALGSGDLLKLTAKLGRGLKEDSFAGGSVPAAGLTKEGAKEELALLQRDKAFATRYLAGEADAVRKFTRLHEVAFAGE
jgi:hypothetical protein